jgi:DNA repair exonuclease SbcCD ATPase subunit
MIHWHKHHLIPRHAGGTDDPSNIIKVNTALHSFLHKQLYEEHGRWQDKIAYECLSGRISKEEAIRQAQSLGQKGKKKPPSVVQAIIESNKRRCGEKHHFYGKKRPPETLKKMSESHLGQEPWNKGRKMTAEEVEVNRQAQLKRPKHECPVCGKIIGGGLGNLKQHQIGKHG